MPLARLNSYFMILFRNLQVVPYYDTADAPTLASELTDGCFSLLQHTPASIDLSTTNLSHTKSRH